MSLLIEWFGFLNRQELIYGLIRPMYYHGWLRNQPRGLLAMLSNHDQKECSDE